MNQPMSAPVLLALGAFVLTLALGEVRTAAAQTPVQGACRLVTATELQTVLGGSVTLTAGSIGDVQTCTGGTQTATATLRLFERTSDPSGQTEQAGIQALKQMGAQVEVKTSGGITCMTTVPPASMAQYGFGTTCTVMSKAPVFAVIEVTAQAQKDMVPMEQLRAITERMAARL